MSKPDDIPERVTRLERDVARARRDAAAARILAGGADRDVSEMRAELRAHTKSLQALRDTQIEQGSEIRGLRQEMNERFEQVDQRFEQVDERFDKIDQRFGMVDQCFENVDQRFVTIEERFARLEGEMRHGFSTLGVGMAQITALLKVAIDRSDES